MKISVALCTYNGAKYLKMQIMSIINQTVKVDEIVVCDDGSVDNTIEIIEEITSKCDISIRLIRNLPSLGVCANFDKAIKECKGDIIFLSDQDDFWMENKVETTVAWFNRNKNKEVAFSNGYFMDDNSDPFTSRTMFEAVGFTEKAQKHFDRGFQIEALLLHNRCTGAAMAFRKTFVPYLNIDITATTKNELPLHDFTIALSAASRNVLGYIAQPLIKYRVHLSQECGLGDWIENPPKDDDLIRPLVPIDRFVRYVAEEVRDRALFGIKRQDYRKSPVKWRVFQNIHNYIKNYGAIAYYPLLHDIF